jgi:hypothetical protein
MEAIEEEIVTVEIDDETYEEIDDVHDATVKCRVRRRGKMKTWALWTFHAWSVSLRAKMSLQLPSADVS